MSKREEKSAKKRKLTAAEKEEIRAIMERARGDGKPHTAQDTLPFRQMFPDGLCKLDDNTWSKCIEFEDVNYQLAQPDQQTAIFEGLCDLYNSHDSSIGMEISLPCRHMNQEDFLKRIEIAAQGDAFDGIRQLYTQMLRRQLEKGNNGIVKSKLLVLTITESDIRAARARFSRITLDALNHFKVMGALAKVLDGREWLELLHGILHPDGERFSFDWDWLAPSGLHVKDFIAPSAFRFASARQFQMGAKFCAASFLQITAPEMDDRILAELLNTESDMLLSIHIRSMDQTEAIKTVKRKITDIDGMKIAAQKNKKRIDNDRENWVVFKDVHEPIIERTIWEQIQEKRGKIRKRKPKDGERNIFSGLLVCADCGHNLNYHFNQGNHDIKYFNCSNYKGNRGTCTSTHYIWVDFLEQVVLGEIKRLTKYAVHYEDEFLQAVMGSTQKTAESEHKRKQKELAAMQARDSELDGLFERIYEDNLSGKLSDERFAKMSQRYEAEQAELAEKMRTLRKEIEKLNSESVSTDMFLSTVRKYTRAKKLTPRMLNELIQRIEVHQAERIDGEWVQKLTIYYNCIGALFIPDTDTLPTPDVTVNTRKGVFVTYEPAQNE